MVGAVDGAFGEKFKKSVAGWIIEVWQLGAGEQAGRWQCTHKGCMALMAGDAFEAEITALQERGAGINMHFCTMDAN